MVNIVVSGWLTIGATKIKSLPDSIEKLINLETLDGNFAPIYSFPESGWAIKRYFYTIIAQQLSLPSIFYMIQNMYYALNPAVVS